MDLYEVKWGALIELMWLMIRQMAGGCERGNEGVS
jgi:hypothetical protein